MRRDFFLVKVHAEYCRKDRKLDDGWGGRRSRRRRRRKMGENPNFELSMRVYLKAEEKRK